MTFYASFLNSIPTIASHWIALECEQQALAYKLFPFLPTYFAQMSNKKSSPLPITITALNQSPYNTNTHMHKPQYDHIAVGGPSALLYSYFHSQKSQSTLFCCDDIASSNLYGSALQYHPRNAHPLYAFDHEALFTPQHILKTLLRRSNPNKIPSSSYLPLDLHIPSVMQHPLSLTKVFLSYTKNYKKQTGHNSSSLKTLTQALESGKILTALEADVGTVLNRSGALTIALNEKQTKAIREKNTILDQTHKAAIEIPLKEYASYLPSLPIIEPGGSIWFYPDEGSLSHDFPNKLLAATAKHGGKILQHHPLEEIIVNTENNQVEGVVINKQFKRTKRLYLSTGYRTQFYDSIGRFPKLSSHIIAGGGFSAYMTTTHSIDYPIIINGCYFTPIAQKNGYSLIKMTGGVLLGTQSSFGCFHKAHAAYTLSFAQQLFGNESFLLAAQGCSRAINGQNSGEFHRPYPNSIIGFGRGGKGLTEMASDAKIVEELLYHA